VNKVLEVLRAPTLKGEAGKKVKKERVRSVSEEMFDFTELSKRSLGQNWKRLNPDQQEEFIKLFKSLLETVYADKITSYTDEKVTFKGEITLSEKAVEVPTTIVTKTSEIPINYRMIEEEGRWKVYDVVIEGVSLVNNYRTQFREILANQTPEALLDILRKKVGEARAS
jgi:phospholipid transport system substrate-binding protein